VVVLVVVGAGGWGAETHHPAPHRMQVFPDMDPDTHLFEAAIQRISGMWWSMKTKGPVKY